MEIKKRSSSEPSYLELQAYVGTTKHNGGLKASRELIELCHTNKHSYVLDVGCGVGVTLCYTAKRHGCKVVGVDISGRMIDWSNKRAKREGVEDRVEFMAADAQNLPFEDALFDAVIGESVITFIKDRQRAVSECARVTKPGGYVGLNEEAWIKALPPTELVEYSSRTWDIEAEIPTPDGWRELLEGSGLRDTVVRTYKIKVLSEFINEFKRYGFKDLLIMSYRSLSLYVRSSAFRKYMEGRPLAPKNLFEYLGYGIYVGRK